MATKPDWADKEIDRWFADWLKRKNRQEKVEKFIARKLRAERRRAVRVVEKAQAYGPNFRGGMVKCDKGEWISKADILAALRGASDV